MGKSLKGRECGKVSAKERMVNTRQDIITSKEDVLKSILTHWSRLETGWMMQSIMIGIT